MADRTFQYGTETQYNTAEAAAKVRKKIPEGGKICTFGGKLNANYKTLRAYRPRVDPDNATMRFWEVDDIATGGSTVYTETSAIAAFNHGQLVVFELENDKTDEDI